MKVIALQGKANSGKTTTLKILITRLSPCAKVLACGYRTKTDAGLSQLGNRIAGDKDLWVLMEYHGKIVGITTEGDEWSFIEKALDSMRKYLNNNGHAGKDVDVFICAIHSGDIMLNKAKQIDCNKDPFVITQFNVQQKDRLQFDLAQSVILECALNNYAP